MVVEFKQRTRGNEEWCHWYYLMWENLEREEEEAQRCATNDKSNVVRFPR